MYYFVLCRHGQHSTVRDLICIILSSVDTDNIPQWEKELQQELQDYELVDDAGDVDDADIENEILQQIEQETNSVWSEGSDQSESRRRTLSEGSDQSEKTSVKSKYLQW